MSTEELRQEIDRVVGECAGAVSLCWEPRPDGVFDSTQAVTYVRGASARLMSVLEAEVASREPIIRADERRRIAEENDVEEREALELAAMKPEDYL